MGFQILQLNELDEKQKKRVDAFILNEGSNGEFINTVDFLSYHPNDRFVDDSIIIIHQKTGEIKSAVMAASHKENLSTIVSHPGTTFAGPIFNTKRGVDEIEELLHLILKYYGKDYSKVAFKLQPTVYAGQPIEDVMYLLLKNGFQLKYSALANIIRLGHIKKEEDVFEMYQSRRRSQIRKLIKDDNYVFSKQDKIEEGIWHHINMNLTNRYEVSTTHSFDEITRLKEKFPKQIVPYTIHKKNGEYAAFVLVFKFKNVFHTQYLDKNYSLKKDYSNVLLNHQLIQVAVEEGYSYFSFGASTENGGDMVNQGLYDFKKTFGGGRIILPVLEKRTG